LEISLFYSKELSQDVIDAIVAERLKHNRCAKIVQANLIEKGM